MDLVFTLLTGEKFFSLHEGGIHAENGNFHWRRWPRVRPAAVGVNCATHKEVKVEQEGLGDHDERRRGLGSERQKRPS
jgi:hypothetical protein